MRSFSVIMVVFVFVSISMSFSRDALADEAHPWDVNGDGAVDMADLTFVGGYFGDSPAVDGDVNGDGVVNIADLILVSVHFGEIYEQDSVPPIADQVFFSDDFEDGDVSDWIGGYYSGTIDKRGQLSGAPAIEVAESGSYALRVTKNQQSGTGGVATSPAFGPLNDRFWVGFDIIPDDSSSHVFWLGEAGPFETNDERQVACFGISLGQGNFNLRTPGYPLLGQYEVGNTYHVAISADPSISRFGVTITGDSLRDADGNPVSSVTADDQVFENSVTGEITRINIYTSAPSASVVVDNVLVEDDIIIGAPPTCEQSASVLAEAGGKIQISDEDSPIYGTSVEIPMGALKEDATISIETVHQPPPFDGDSTGIFVSLEPSGIQFDEPVKIGIPYDKSILSEDPNELNVYYFDEGSSVKASLQSPQTQRTHQNKSCWEQPCPCSSP